MDKIECKNCGSELEIKLDRASMKYTAKCKQCNITWRIELVRERGNLYQSFQNVLDKLSNASSNFEDE